jgi:hypothetical protein
VAHHRVRAVIIAVAAVAFALAVTGLWAWGSARNHDRVEVQLPPVAASPVSPAAAETPTVTPSPKPSPSHKPKPPKLGAACNYLSDGDIEGAMQSQLARDPIVDDESGNATHCRYEVFANIDDPTQGETFITITWYAGKHNPDAFQFGPAPGVPRSTLFNDGGICTLSVQSAHGYVSILVQNSPQFYGNVEKIAIDLYDSAKHRLP